MSIKRTFVTFADGDKYEKLAQVLKDSINSFSEYDVQIYNKSNFNLTYDVDFSSSFGYLYKILSCVKALENYDEVVWIDTDCIVTNYIDKIWFENFRLNQYPLLPKYRFYMFHKRPDNPKVREISFKKLNLDYIDGDYLQACFMFFNKSSLDFFNEVLSIFSNKFTTKEFPLGDETIMNCLLRKYQFDDNLGYKFMCTHQFNGTRMKNFVKSSNSLDYLSIFEEFKPKDNFFENILFLHGSKNVDFHRELLEKLKLKMGKI
jgi:hypothetical protein